MKSSDRVALSLSACKAADRQQPETEQGEASKAGRKGGSEQERENEGLAIIVRQTS